jgi:hypothetical protein
MSLSDLTESGKFEVGRAAWSINLIQSQFILTPRAQVKPVKCDQQTHYLHDWPGIKVRLGITPISWPSAMEPATFGSGVPFPNFPWCSFFREPGITQ